MKKVFNKRRIIALSVFLALAAAVLVYINLLNAERKMLSEYEKKWIYVCTKEIHKGEKITEENVYDFFEKKEIEASVVNGLFVTNLEEIIDRKVKATLNQGTIIMKGMFEKGSEAGRMKNPVLCGFTAKDLYMIAGGILRQGDRINIYRIEEEKGATLIKSNVYVEDVFEKGGGRIAASDSIQPASMVNVLIDESEALRFFEDVSYGEIMVVKIYD